MRQGRRITEFDFRTNYSDMQVNKHECAKFQRDRNFEKTDE
jgi:hypothetical protein